MERRKNSNSKIERLRQKSPILNVRQRNVRNGIFNENSADDLKSRIILLEGGDEYKNQRWNSEKKKFETAFLEVLRNKLKKVQQEFESYKQMEINTGNRPPKQWPPHLLEKREDAEAHLAVAEEELSWLKSKLEKVEAEAEKPAKEGGLFADPRTWSSSTTRDGIIDTVAGQKCAMNEEGILYITDESSPYQGMLVWKFKGEIALPMFREYSHRQRAEVASTLKENRIRRKVDFPPAPTYNKATDTVVYEGYSDSVLKKLQTTD